MLILCKKQELLMAAEESGETIDFAVLSMICFFQDISELKFLKIKKY